MPKLKMSPNALSMKLARKHDWVPWRVEQRLIIPGSFGATRDLLNIVDTLCFHIASPELVGIQACARSGLAPHLNKIAEARIGKEADSPLALDLWCSSPNRKLLVMGWDKPGHRYRVRIVEVLGFAGPGSLLKREHEDVWPFVVDEDAPKPEPAAVRHAPF